jgi:hypothetical protein
LKKIKYIVTNDKYLAAKELHPQPVSNFIPSWISNVKVTYDTDSILDNWQRRLKNIRSCPSFTDIYKEGYVILAPTDIRISYENNEWFWRTPYDLFDGLQDENITFHDNKQMVDYLPTTASTRIIFKINMPMFLDVPKGYRMRVMPVPFTYNNDWSASPGVYDPNKVNQVNILIEYTSSKDELLIKQGTPLAVHVPYKKEKYNLLVEQYDHKKHSIIRFKNTLLTQGRFHSAYMRGLKND